MKQPENSYNSEPELSAAGENYSHPAQSSSDFYPNVVELQRRLGATGFVVASTSKAGIDGTHLKVMMANASYERDKDAQNLLKEADLYFFAHVKKSACPGYWHSVNSTHEQIAVPRPATLMPLDNPQNSGIAFPINLGGRMTGLIIFFSPSVAITSEMQLDIHRKACQILRPLLKLEFSGRGKLSAINSRETECLQFAGNGMTSDDIAEHLSLSVHTVNAHLASATNKLDSVNRIQAIAKAIRLGLIT